MLDIKLKSQIADSILCTQVIEHVESPDKLIKEISRTAKSNAICILTAPFFARIHGEPHDYYRFTRFGLKQLFEKNGFKIVVLEEIGGFWLTIVYLTIFYIVEKLKKFAIILTPMICLLYLCIQKFDKNKNHPCLYVVVAKKNNDS